MNWGDFIVKIDTKKIQVESGETWKQFTLTNDNGVTAEFLDYGGIITKILVPDNKGNIENVVLGYENLEDYKTNPFYLGALIGRVAGRIKGATFHLNGNTYSVESNDGENCLHGGLVGFNHVLWETTSFQTEDKIGVHLIYRSMDGEGGFPGNVDIEVTYTLTNYNQFIIDYYAKSDKTTPLTLTNHSYFNLSGNLKNTVHQQHVVLDSRKFVELDEALIPTGKLVNVEGTSFDFRNGRRLGEGFNEHTKQNSIANEGYDHYFLFDNALENNIVMKDIDSGRILSVRTNQPGVVMYTSTTLPEGLRLAEGLSERYLGVCFETQSSPASLHEEDFPSVILEPGEPYEKQTVFSFDIED